MRERILRLALVTLFLAPIVAPAVGEAALALGLIDRKFPIFTFCPIETRDGNLVSFVAPSNGSVRVTFAADNFYTPPGFTPEYNEPRIDNFMLIPRSLWDANTTVCGAECFTENGVHLPAPTYPSDATNLSALPIAELFDTDPFAVASPIWEGGSWNTDFTAPQGDASGTDCLFASGGGSIVLGQPSDGDVSVSTAVTVEGLTPGTEYVVFAWLYVRNTGACTPPSDCYTQLSIIVDETDPVATQSTTFGRIKAVFH